VTAARGVRLALRQLRYEDRAFWRNPAAAFFTFVFPLMFLAIFTLIFGNERIETPRGEVISGATFYVAAIVAFSVVNASFTNLAMTVSLARDQGLLKRVRGTPLPTWAFLSGKVLHAVIVGVILVVIVVAVGRVFYDVEVPTNTIPAVVVALIVGTAAFAALGLAMSALVPNADAAPAVVNAVILPLLFISDVFIPLENAPAWLRAVGDVFPVKPFAETLHIAFNPFTEGAGFQWDELTVVAVWGVVGMVAAARFFSWEPRR
jgi:ABC-2 type transport system permease protein